MEFTEDQRDELFDDIAGIEFVKGSIKKGYKYKAYIPKEIWDKWRPDSPLKRKDYKTVNFGRAGYKQFHDKIGEWSDYDHNDTVRRDRYRKRHIPIRITIDDKKLISYLVPFTNEFFSYWLMW